MIDYAKIDTSHNYDMDMKIVMTGVFMAIAFVTFLFIGYVL